MPGYYCVLQELLCTPGHYCVLQDIIVYSRTLLCTPGYYCVFLAYSGFAKVLSYRTSCTLKYFCIGVM